MIPLPPAMPAPRLDIETRSGRVSCYTAGPRARGSAKPRPLLLIHSINAAASACEVRPLFQHYRGQRPVYALELPGFGFSARSDRAYTPGLMTDAIAAVADDIRRREGSAPIDALAVSLSCEFLARAALESPAQFRSLALVSPTGFGSGGFLPSGLFAAPPGGTRGWSGLHRLLSNPLWSQALFRQLTRRPVIRFFLEKTWGSRQIDQGLLDYCCITSRQPGARFAPLYFLSGLLFSTDIRAVYLGLRQPVWMVHGVRGDFVDYRYEHTVASQPNWSLATMQTGALPYFEQCAEFSGRYDTFLAAAVAPAARRPKPRAGAAPP